ncbi:MAG TPA: LPS assembly protein LptD, partial [Burkholderiaceae bacterium]|nr:LPS assembly protein LptD [Burkholderiaceae bacterium]
LFELSDRFVWGWDGTVLSDKTFLQDYRLGRYSDPLAFQKDNTAAISQLFLSGRGDRSFFDIRGMFFYGFSEADSQTQLPVIHPVMDYSYVFGQPVFGGELAFNANLTSLSRREADYDPITQDALVSKMCDAPTADTAKRVNCVLRGIPGSYTRFSGEAQWRRTFTDPLGQVVTPFMSFRADVASLSVKGDPAVAQFIDAGEEQFARNMPTVGVDYRYPFISAHGWGTQTIEPIAQVVVRPNESRVGRMPNEDAQSLVYDDSNLFRVDKFSGWDRMEGGGRANVGAQYTAQFNGAGMFNVLFGQSYHLFGKNSFAAGDTANTGLDSGLETDRSDYVARATWQPSSVYALTTRYRFDEQSFEVRRFELEGRVNYDRWWGSLLYGNYDAQPLLGFLQRREGVLGTASVKVTQNWSVLGSARYDLDAGRIDQTVLGLGYIDDCFAIAVNYITDHTVSGNTQTDQKLMLQISLRTLGGTAFTQKVGTTTTSNTSSLGVGY